MQKTTQRMTYPLDHYIKRLALLLIPVVLVELLLSFFTVLSVQNQNKEHIQETVDLYVEEMNRKFGAIEHFMRWTVLLEPLLTGMEAIRYEDGFLEDLGAFRGRIADFQYSSGKEYQFFLSLADHDFFINCSDMYIDYGAYRELTAQMPALLADNRETKSAWRHIALAGEDYLYFLANYRGKALLCLISVKEACQPLEGIDLLGGSILMHGANYLFDIQDGQVTSLDTLALDKPFVTILPYTQEASGLPFSLYVQMRQFGSQERLILIQAAIILVAIIMTGVLLTSLLLLRSRVLLPIKAFAENLANLNEGAETYGLQSSRIAELEQANQQFRNLMDEIKLLRINLYERELDNKRIEMDFLRLQIKPHFYLSCLTTIHSMAQMGMTAEIETLAISTSKYLRYLLQTNQDFVRLEDELEHIRCFMDINRLRYGPTITIEETVDEVVRQSMVPPLILHSFVENSIKHSELIDAPLSVRLSVQLREAETGAYLDITIADTGTGFEPDILAELQMGQFPYSGSGGRIGIRNAIQRLELLYSGGAKIRFANGEDGGARVYMHIPYYDGRITP